MTNKRLIITMACFVITLLFGFGSIAYAATDSALSTAGTQKSLQSSSTSVELEKVKARFPNSEKVLEATNRNLDDKLSDAGSLATAKKPVIVHATGTIKVNSVEIPSNVILVGESTTTYVYSGSGGQGTRMFKMNGSVFGGIFQGKKAYYNITSLGIQGSDVNGFIEDISISSGAKYGISVRDASKSVKIANCTVSGVGDCGIQSTGGSTIDYIKNCKISKCGESGIDLIYANVKLIQNNVIKNCGGHGISSDTDPRYASSYPQQKYCKISKITGNTITGSVHHAIYLEQKCTINLIEKNTISNSKKAGICINAGGVVKNVVSNKLFGCGVSNISVSGKRSTLYLGDGNKTYKSRHHGISVSDKGRLYITGKNNMVYNNKKSGINAVDGASVTIKGEGTQVYNSGQSNIVASGKKAVVNISAANVVSYNAKNHGVSASAGGKVTITGTNFVIRNNRHNGVNVSGSTSAITFTGKELQIKDSAKNGISLNGGCKATIANAKFSGNKVLAVYVGENCKFSYKKCNIKTSKNARNRVYYA